ncbi:hypothetical protein C8T65DRAFT_547144, partial [Cerioporus squamosus]
LRRSKMEGIQIPGMAERLIATLFADDTTVYMSHRDSYADLEGILTTWCKASRARFNVGKTEHLPIGTKEFRESVVSRTSDVVLVRTLPRDSSVVEDGRAIRALGAWIGNKTDQEAPWRPIVEAIKTRLKKWDLRHPTMYGRKLAVGMEVGSRSQFLTRAQGMPEKVEEELEKLAVSFVWSGDKRP